MRSHGLYLSSSLPGSVHVVTDGKGLFFFMTGWNSTKYIYHIFSIHSSTDGHPDCSHILDTVNNAAVNIRLDISPQIYVFVFFRQMPGSGIAVLCAGSIYGFLRNLHTVPYPLLKLAICCLPSKNHSARREVISHCDLDLHCHNDW